MQFLVCPKFSSPSLPRAAGDLNDSAWAKLESFSRVSSAGGRRIVVAGLRSFLPPPAAREVSRAETGNDSPIVFREMNSDKPQVIWEHLLGSHPFTRVSRPLSEVA